MEEGDDRPVIDVSSGVGGGGGGGDVERGRSEVILPRGEVVTDGADDDLSTERTTPRAPSTAVRRPGRRPGPALGLLRYCLAALAVLLGGWPARHA